MTSPLSRSPLNKELITSPLSNSPSTLELEEIWRSQVTLEQISNTCGNINKMRMLLQGNLTTLKNLLEAAEKKGDAIVRIQLSHAFLGMKWGNDSLKNFSILKVEDLEEFDYYPGKGNYFNSEVESQNMNWRQTFITAAKLGYLPAVLELKYNEWPEDSYATYGFAVALQSFVGKGNKMLDYYFGLALKNGSQIGSPLYYEGMRWMHQSHGICVKYPENNQPFEEFIRGYQSPDYMNCDHRLDGLYHLGKKVILAPSKIVWETFVREKLANVQCAPPESHCVKYDGKEICRLLNENTIAFNRMHAFVDSTTEGTDFECPGGQIRHGFWIVSFVVYENRREIGRISVQHNNLKIHETFKNTRLQPVINFIENVMTRTGSPKSTVFWLNHIKDLFRNSI
ncbi:MAG: hypothetical protein RLZZ453_410 [Chlamydiota bacterium]|jgi:hypothetical protein